MNDAPVIDVAKLDLPVSASDAQDASDSQKSGHLGLVEQGIGRLWQARLPPPPYPLLNAGGFAVRPRTAGQAQVPRPWGICLSAFIQFIRG